MCNSRKEKLKPISTLASSWSTSFRYWAQLKYTVAELMVHICCLLEELVRWRRQVVEERPVNSSWLGVNEQKCLMILVCSSGFGGSNTETRVQSKLVRIRRSIRPLTWMLNMSPIMQSNFSIMQHDLYMLHKWFQFSAKNRTTNLPKVVIVKKHYSVNIRSYRHCVNHFNVVK